MSNKFSSTMICIAAFMGLSFIASPAWSQAQKTTAIISLATDGKLASSQPTIKSQLPVIDGLTVDFNTMANGNPNLCAPTLTNLSGSPVTFGYTSYSSLGAQTKTVSLTSLASGSSESVDIDDQVYCGNSAVLGKATGSEVETAQIYVSTGGQYRWWEVKWWSVNSSTTPTNNKTVFFSAERLR
ncbi:hypothetical protein [Burkholderia alba]|uniref:hypothetical protein n=1 Tax=Burkholderia alba TaxID=2683677 RepID=UPI002B05E1DC|nr:hypothetical protein [Burkholderia alba]